MEIDRRSLDKLLTLSDTQLKMVIRNLASNSGIDPREFNIDLADVSSIRRAVSTISDEELARIVRAYEENHRKK